MLDPRIYRTGLVVVVLGVLVLAFSLANQPAPLNTTLPPDAFSGANAYHTMSVLASQYPNRSPGTAGDDALAGYVSQKLRGYGFLVGLGTFKGRTVLGTRTLERVTATRPGLQSGSVVVVAHRDSLGSGGLADLSGTAVLLELARVLSGQTQHRSIVLVSTTGSLGAAGTTQLARTLPAPVDAVIVLGDLAAAHISDPIVVPWSSTDAVAPPLLRNTLDGAVSAQTQLRPGGAGLGGQLAHLALPVSVTEQAPFGARGVPSVLLSLSGERNAGSDERVVPTQLTGLGRAVLETVGGLDTGPAVPRPSAYLLFDRKVVPGWAIRLFVLALLAPVFLVTVDALARVRRRGHALAPWLVWVLASGVPFVLAALAVLGCRAAGLIKAAPPGAVGAGAIPLHGRGVAVLGLVACALALGFFVLRRLVIFGFGARLMRQSLPDVAAAAGAALLLVMCILAVVVWIANPFAAALVVIALHAWMWIVDPDLVPRRTVIPALLLVGVAPLALVVLYQALNLGYGPLDLIWTGVLMIAGGQLSYLAALAWSVGLGCLVSVVLIAVRSAGTQREHLPAITVRGPVTYAGPGSLGGTESALRRVRT